MLELARLGVATRPGWQPRARARTGSRSSSSSRMPVSSTEIRERVRARRADRRARRPRGRRVHRRARSLSRRLTDVRFDGYNECSDLPRTSTPDRRSRQEKLAEDVVILDMRPVCVYTDFFVIATGRNPRQTKAIYDEVHGQLKQESKLLPRAVDGQQEATWIVADYLDVVLHVFTPETRAVLPARGPLGRRPSGRRRSRDGVAIPSGARTNVRMVLTLGSEGMRSPRAAIARGGDQAWHRRSEAALRRTSLRPRLRRRRRLLRVQCKWAVRRGDVVVVDCRSSRRGSRRVHATALQP